MLLEIRQYFLLFIIYSFVGWIMEIIYTLFTEKKLNNRGFLIGPYCPIYGVGCLLILLMLSKYQSHPFGLFTLAIVICSILEYFTSYLMEKLFKARWWDYSNNRFNINGRICLETMIPFGLIACLIIYIVNPFVVTQLNKLPENLLTISAIVLAVLFLIDVITSFNIVNNFKKTVKKVSIEDKTEDINKYVKKLLLEKSFLYRRLIKAFPKIEAKITKIKKDIKKDLEEKIKKD